MLLPELEPLDGEDVRSILAAVLEGLLTGSIDAGTARAAGYIVQTERRIAESEVLERRIAALEQLLDGRVGTDIADC